MSKMLLSMFENDHVFLIVYVLSFFLLRDDERLTPLHLAAFCGCPMTAGILLDRGAKIDAMDKNGV